MAYVAFDPTKGQKIKTAAKAVKVDRAFLAHFQVAAADAVVADADGILAAVACSTPAVAATCVVKALSALTDILTTSAPIALGAAPNELKILLTTAADDVLAVTKTDGTKTINIALAKTTANKNTATLIQAAIRGLVTVGGVSVATFTCAAGGNWDTAAVATGESGAVSFSGGQTAAAQVITTFDGQPAVPRNVTATAGGTSGDVKAVQVVVTGTNMNDEVISETLPAFTVNQTGIVTGAKAFKTVTSVTIPAHDGTGATTAIGFGSLFGLPFKLAHNTVLDAFFGNVKESTPPTVAVSATALESNTIGVASTLDGSALDAYLIV